MDKMSPNLNSFLNCRGLWEQLDTSEQKQALLAVSEIWNNPEESIDKIVPDEILSVLQSKEILIRDQEGAWQFILPQLPAFVQALNHIRSQRLHTLPYKEILQNLLQATGIRHSHEQRHIVSFTIAHLVNEYGLVQLPGLIVENASPQEEFWQIAMVNNNACA